MNSNSIQFLAVLSLLWHLALTAFWIYIAVQGLKALRQIASTLRRIAVINEEAASRDPGKIR